MFNITIKRVHYDAYVNILSVKKTLKSKKQHEFCIERFT